MIIMDISCKISVNGCVVKHVHLYNLLDKTEKRDSWDQLKKGFKPASVNVLNF